ncbi:zf-CCHC domain-containing protein [Tanacetum coccineum]
MMNNPETKMEVKTPYELLKDDQNKQLGKNNKDKMTLYNALPRKEYKQVFMCKTVKEDFRKYLPLRHNGEDCYNADKKGHFINECPKPKENKAFFGRAWSDSEDGDEPQNDATCLMAIDSQKKSKILSKVNGLELKVKKLGKPKEVIEPFKKGDALTKEVDSLKCNVSRLQDEALDSSKFKKSNVVLDNMLSRQKLSQGQNMAPEKSAHDTLGDAPARHRRANRPSKIGVLFNDFAKLVDPQTCFANTRDIQTPITRVETTKQGYHLVSRN